jgi:hypothetical protein
MNARVGPPSSHAQDWTSQTLASFGGAIEALRAVAAISPEEAHDSMNLMLLALGLEPMEPVPTNSAVARAVSPREIAPPLSRPPLARFLTLIPVAEADRPLPFGGRVQILGIERYDTKVTVAWRLAPLPNVEEQFAGHLELLERDIEGLPDDERQRLRLDFRQRLNRPGMDELALSDDLGTDYQQAGASSGGGNDERVGRTQFRPAIPDQASQLTVHWGELHFEVAIP